MNPFKNLSNKIAYAPSVIAVGGGGAALNMPKPDPVNSFFMSI